MSQNSLPSCPRFPLPEVTRESLDYTEVIVIDFADHENPQRHIELSKQISSALHNSGYCFLINHGLNPDQVQRTFDIADIAFSGATDDEKKKFAMQEETGSYKGYKVKGKWHIANGKMDHCEMYNITTDFAPESHPSAIHPFLPELASFSSFCHQKMAHEIMRLLAMDLKVPENTLVDMHQYGPKGESYTRLMKYYPRARIEDEEAASNLWLSGHTDVGSLTILLSQPISGLQFHCSDGKWRWAPHIPGALLVQAGDCLEFLSGGYYRSHFHRVVTPAKDQRHLQRLGIGYFLRPDNDKPLDPLPTSPVLQQYGVKSLYEGTSWDWKQERVRMTERGELNGSRIGKMIPVA